MVAFNRFLAAAFAFATTTTLAMPYGNATLDARATGDVFCGANYPPIPGLAGADEDLIKSATTEATPAARTIGVYWNVITRDNSYPGGNMPDSHIANAISVLNQHFSPLGTTFQVAGVKRIQNPTWFDQVDLTNQGENDYSKQMKSQLRQGSVRELNIYSVGLSNSGYLGYATFPWWYQGAPAFDGVVFKWNTTPGGSNTGFNTGKILVHEVGHWVGLLHTFEGGCNGGDYVDDTPAEASPASGCPRGRDTCPGAGLDPIENHMDYSDDSCRIGFTPGQMNRANAALIQYRGL